MPHTVEVTRKEDFVFFSMKIFLPIKINGFRVLRGNYAEQTQLKFNAFQTTLISCTEVSGAES